MYTYFLISLICLIDTSYAIYYTVSHDEYNIPGSPMQFNVTVSDSASPFSYRFDLFENVTNSTDSFDDSLRITKNYIFPFNTTPGIYRLNVQVYFMFDVIKIMKISGPSTIDFNITASDKLNGTIKYTQENLPQSAYRSSFVSCFSPISFVSQIEDFHNYFQNATFNWFINGTQLPNITRNQLNYTLNSEHGCNITTKFKATTNNNLTMTGRSERIVVAYKPLASLNLTGIPNISWKRNKNLEIYVNFMNGSKPFWYCYQIFSDDKTKLACNDPVETMQDYFKVTKRFSRNGTYYLKIKAGNMVTKLEKSFPISVIDFEKKSQMIIIIMPIVAFILILAILLAGILYHVNKRNKFITEVADFNFETRSQASYLSEETFFQRLKNTFINSIKDITHNRGETQFKHLENLNSGIDDT